jgi:hypothetical protein
VGGGNAGNPYRPTFTRSYLCNQPVHKGIARWLLRHDPGLITCIYEGATYR